MSPMVWAVLLIAFLIFEFVKANLYGACGAAGCVGGIIAFAFSLHPVLQFVIAAAIAVVLIFTVRPIGMKYVNRIKKHNAMLSLEGSDAIVICRVDNAQGVGVVNIAGREWSARSNRPNTVFNEGEVVKVIAMRNGKAYVDYRNKKNGEGRNEFKRT